jgi:hypothetical protein
MSTFIVRAACSDANASSASRNGTTAVVRSPQVAELLLGFFQGTG